MPRLFILIGVLSIVAGCSQPTDQEIVSGDSSGSTADSQGTQAPASFSDAPALNSPTSSESAMEKQTTSQRNQLSKADTPNNTGTSQAQDREKMSLREEHEDEITTRLGRALLDVLDEIDGGSDEERDAVIATLKLKDEELHRASGKRARQLILQNNNRPRSLYVPPPPE